MTLRALPYHGGKSPMSASGTGPWIASLLPYRPVYVEPFAGMLGVLLARRPSLYEVAGDADNRIVDWWRAVRDHPTDFARLVERTPRSRTLYEEAMTALAKWDEPDLLRRALAVHIGVHYGMMQGLGKNGFPSFKKVSFFDAADIDALAARLRKVQLESIDACDLAARVAPREDTVVYLDPPYGGEADTTPYGARDFDKAALTATVEGAAAFIAISGYGDDWDHLEGWQRHVRGVPQFAGTTRTRVSRRVEVLWTNRPTAAQPDLFA